MNTRKRFSFLLALLTACIAGPFALAQAQQATPSTDNTSTAPDEAAALQYRLENEGDVLAVVQAREDGQLDVLHGRITNVLITGASAKVEKEIRRLLAPPFGFTSTLVI